jgi:dihydrofolate reductase
MNLIVAVDNNWAIGYKNDLLISIPDDMKFFRETTTGNVIIMGRKTLNSFPNGKPLKNRVNIVITKDTNFKADGAIVVNSIEEAVKDPKKVEMALWKIIPPEEGSDFCHRLVDHGREVCTARTTPHCDKCCLNDICKKRI